MSLNGAPTSYSAAGPNGPGAIALNANVLVLNRYDLALARIGEVIRQARTEIGNHWGRLETPHPKDSRSEPHSPDFYEHWPARTTELKST